MDLHLLHGIVDSWSPSLYSHRIYVSRASLTAYLKKRRNRYSSWAEDRPTGDVLTIDDSTKAGAEACLLARGLGHEVIYFVNPLPVITGNPYFFSYLDAYIDGRRSNWIDFETERFDLTNTLALRQFRKKVKVALMGQPDEYALEKVKTVGEMLGAKEIAVPSHAAPIARKDLIQLRDAGVQIENHGWSHVEIASLGAIEFSRHIEMAREWFKDQLDIDPLLYACPYGETLVPDAWTHSITGPYLLADSKLPSGPVRPRCWNRLDVAHLVREH